MMKKLSIVFLALIFVCGCAATKLDIKRYEPVPKPPKITTFDYNGERYISYEGREYGISAGLFEYKDVFILHLIIKNKTGRDLWPQHYSVALYDGRDKKPIKMITREDVSEFEQKSKGVTNLPLSNPAVEFALNTILDTFSTSTRSLIIKELGEVIANYFDFRPVYAHETREGVLAFLLDFRLEYPLTLSIGLDKEKIDLNFSGSQE